MKMKAAVLYEANTPLVVEEVELRGPGPGEVLVQYAASGVCHSDYHIVKGDWPHDLPLVLGHEGAGTVEEVGRGVTVVAPGDRVVLSWKPNCGSCAYCITGRPHLCTDTQDIDEGSGIWLGDDRVNMYNRVASFAEYMVAPEQGMIPIREEMPLDLASLLGCAVMTGVGAVINTARVEPGSSVAVFGCGGVGLSMIQGARLVSAARIIAVDVQDHKLEFARRFGATDGINALNQDPVEAIKEITGGEGADYAFEAIGIPQVMEQALTSVRRQGMAVVVGIPERGQRMSFPTGLLIGERMLTGSLYGSGNLRMDIPRLVDFYLAGKLDLDTLVTRRYALEGVNDAFAAMGAGEVGRGIITY
jgi:S-(hydroxymethyl)glutathione dehydrogenase/alcohol dehydrogenase